MNDRKEIKTLGFFLLIFLLLYFLPIDSLRFRTAIFEALELSKWYAREHVLLCLIPAFFIAGAISVFVKQEAVLKYLGSGSSRVLSYGVASVSGAILAVCSCTVLPIFAGIYHQGAGIGPASAFLYSGPAINVLAIILSAKVLGIEIGITRAICAIIFSIIIGLLMEFLFRKSDSERLGNIEINQPKKENRKLWQEIIYFATLVGILVFANWGNPGANSGIFQIIYSIKWYITSFFALLLSTILILWFKANWKLIVIVAVILIAAQILYQNPTITFVLGTIGLVAILSTGSEEMKNWLSSTWDFTKQIVPLLFFGVLIAGFVFGRPGTEGIVPSKWVSELVGGNSLFSNFFAAIFGAFMYFATLTEVPIVQGLLGSGMGKGPALALLLSGPALSLPSMLVINSVLGTKKTLTFIFFVVLFSTLIGYIFGSL